MEKIDLVYDSAFNLIKAAEENQKRVDNSLKVLEVKSTELSRTINSINSKFSEELTSASEIASQKIIDNVSLGLEDAKSNAVEAARIYKKNVRFSIFKLGGMFFLFFLIAGSLLWYFFIKDIPTIEELYKLRSEQKILNERYEELRKYGDIKFCGENNNYTPCVKIDKSAPYQTENGDYYKILPK